MGISENTSVGIDDDFGSPSPDGDGLSLANGKGVLGWRREVVLVQNLVFEPLEFLFSEDSSVI